MCTAFKVTNAPTENWSQLNAQAGGHIMLLQSDQLKSGVQLHGTVHAAIDNTADQEILQSMLTVPQTGPITKLAQPHLGTQPSACSRFAPLSQQQWPAGQPPIPWGC